MFWGRGGGGVNHISGGGVNLIFFCILGDFLWGLGIWGNPPGQEIAGINTGKHIAVMFISKT